MDQRLRPPGGKLGARRLHRCPPAYASAPLHDLGVLFSLVAPLVAVEDLGHPDSGALLFRLLSRPSGRVRQQMYVLSAGISFTGGEGNVDGDCWQEKEKRVRQSA